MYDICFDLHDMHQTVEESDQLEEEFWAIGEVFDFDLVVDEDFIDDYPVIVKQTKVKTKGNGLTCPKCGEIYPYAESNQPDGSFKCWSCRNF